MMSDLECEHERSEVEHEPPVALPMVLLVEDDPDDADYILDMLACDGSALHVEHVSRMRDALSLIADATPWCVLLDLGLPDADSMEGPQQLRAAAPGVPIVVLTGRDQKGTGIRAMRCGAQDYLIKGQIDAWMLGRAMRYAVERKDNEASLRSLALHDSLTGLPNRVLFLDRVEHALARLRREHTTLAVLFLDLDEFKAVNDQLGHAAGDALLEEVAERLTTSTRPGDTVARLGGDEFVILLEKLTREVGVLSVLDRIRAALNRPFVIGERPITIRASIGTAFSSCADDHPDTLIAEADRAMYNDKSRGRQLRIDCA